MDEINIFLLMGQSNMAGRGHLSEVPDLSHPDILMFRDGRWIAAKEPLHTDKPAVAGAGLGMGFAVELLHCRAMRPVGLVPCAVGGTPLSRWMPGGDLYANAVSQARQALAGGVLKGVLWHQGETDSGNTDDANRYGQRLESMISRLRLDLEAEAVPVITGELGQFLEHYSTPLLHKVINRQLGELEGRVSYYACVSAAGLTDNGDALHFNAASLREFGRRYADAYVGMTGGSETGADQP